MNIVMVGSRSFPLNPASIHELVLLMDPWSREDTVIHTRSAKGHMDAVIAEAAKAMGFEVRYWPGGGGPANFVRDVEMVKEADEVYAFFSADSIGEGGTQHVIDKALDRGKPTASYAWVDARLVLVGSSDHPGDAGGVGKGAEGEAEVAGEGAPERPEPSSEGPRGRKDAPVWPTREAAGTHPRDR